VTSDNIDFVITTPTPKPVLANPIRVFVTQESSAAAETGLETTMLDAVNKTRRSSIEAALHMSFPFLIRGCFLD
jgi:hypothetical protein